MNVLIIQENGRHRKNRHFRECFALQSAFQSLGWEADIWGLYHHDFPSLAFSITWRGTRFFGLKHSDIRDIFVIGADMVKAINSYKIHFNRNIANDINSRNF